MSDKEKDRRDVEITPEDQEQFQSIQDRTAQVKASAEQNKEHVAQKNAVQQSSGKKKQSLLSRLLGAGNKEASNLAQGAKSGFLTFKANMGKNIMGGITKVASMFGVKDQTAIIFLSIIIGGGVLFTLSQFEYRKHEGLVKNEIPWTCVGDVIDTNSGLASQDEDIQENVNIMYDVFVNHYGYSEQFLIGMISCFITESHVQAEIIEHGTGEAAEQAFFAACGSPSGGVDANTSKQAYWAYGQQFPNANSGYMDSNGNVCVGLGLVQWTGERGDKLLDGQDVISGDYHWYDLAYQLAFLLAEFQNSYPSLAPDSGEWQGLDAYNSTVNFFTTFVSGGNSDPALVSQRTDNIPEATGYVMAAAANSQYTSDVDNMASILAGSDLAAGFARNADATICDNGYVLQTSGIVDAALSVAWLEGGDYANDDEAGASLRRSFFAPYIINDASFTHGGKRDLWASTQYYYQAHLFVLPQETGIGSDGYFSSCDRSACVPVRMSGADANFPAGNPVMQLTYMLTGSASNAGEVDDADSVNESYDAGDLTAAEGTRNADGNELWNPVGFLRGDVLYSYTGAANISSGTLMVSMGNQDNGFGNLPSRFVDMSNLTTRHIMIYAGVNAVQSYYGDYIYDQKRNYAATADESQSVTSDIAEPEDLPEGQEVPIFNWIKEELAFDYHQPDNTDMDDYEGTSNSTRENAFFLDYGDFTAKIDEVMTAGNSFKRKYAKKGNDQKESFLTIGEEKNGLNTFKAWEEIKHDIEQSCPSWSADQVQAFTDMVYQQQQHNRWMLITQYCSLPNEEDAAIGTYYDNVEGLDQNAYVNGYQYMPAHIDASGELISHKFSLFGEEEEALFDEDNPRAKYWIDDPVNDVTAPYAHEFFQYNTVISNDLFQDLIQMWSKKQKALDEDVYQDAGRTWGVTAEDFREVEFTSMGYDDYQDQINEYNDLFVPITIEKDDTEYESNPLMFTYDPEENPDPDSEEVYEDEDDRVPTWLDEHYENIDGVYMPKVYLIINADESHLEDDETERADMLGADITDDEGRKNKYGDNFGLDADHVGREPFINTKEVYNESIYSDWEDFDQVEELHKNLSYEVEIPGHEDREGHYEVIDTSNIPDTVLATTFRLQWKKTGRLNPETGGIEVDLSLDIDAYDEFWAHAGYDHKDDDYYQWRYLDKNGNEMTWEELVEKFETEWFPAEDYAPEEDPTEDGQVIEGEVYDNETGEGIEPGEIVVYVQMNDKDFDEFSDFSPSQMSGRRRPNRDYVIQLKPDNIKYTFESLDSERTDIDWANQWTASAGESWSAGDPPPSYGYPRPDKTAPYIAATADDPGNAYAFIAVNADGLVMYEHLKSDEAGTGTMTDSYLQDKTKGKHYLMNTIANYAQRTTHVTVEDLFGVHTKEPIKELYTGTAADWQYVNGIHSEPDMLGDPQGSYSLISKIAGGDHVMHVGLGGLNSPRVARDEDSHYDMYGNEILDPVGDFAHWVVHGSRGTRGPKVAYLDFYGFFEQEGKKFSYMLFMSTPKSIDEELESIGKTRETATRDDWNQTDWKYKVLIDTYNDQMESSR